MKRKQFMAGLLTAAMVSASLSLPGTALQAEAASKPLTKISIAKKATIYTGTKKTLKVTKAPKAASAKITWKSSNKKVASVSKKGVVKGIKAGKATITASAKDKSNNILTASCKVTVKKTKPVKKLTVDAASITLDVGSARTIKTTIIPKNASIKKLNYKSSNTAVASVSSKGKITAKKAGSAVITVSAADGSKKKAAIQVTVKTPAAPQVKVSKITVKQAEFTLEAGSKQRLETTIAPANATNKQLKYTLSDPYAASVSADGTITALAQGSTDITIEAADGSGAKAKAHVTVVDTSKPKAIVMTDGEVDDMDSLVRLLLYTNEVDLAGIIQTSASLRWKGSADAPYDSGKNSYRWPGTEWKHEIVAAYGEVYENLRVHDPNYPTPNYLKSVTVDGNIDWANDMTKSSDGSSLIKEAILDIAFGRDTRSLSLQSWGGPVTAARALKEIEDEYKSSPQWNEIYNSICDKVVLNVCGFQDDTYDKYIALSYPDMKAVNIGFGVFAYSTANQGTPAMQERLSGAWHAENIEFNHGALLDKYVTMGDGTYLHGEASSFQYGANDDMLNNPNVFGGSKERYHFISEGDSPTYFHLLDTGLRSLEGDNYGGWAGRYTKQNTTNASGAALTKRYSSARDFVTTERANPDPQYKDGQVENAQIRWTEQLQNDFAGRADWCIADKYEKANHRPDLTIKEGLDITAAPGERVTLNAKTSDPDGDKVSVNWWHYYEAGKDVNGSAENKDKTLVINGSEANAKNTKKAVFTIPKDAKKGDTFHIIATATDNGAHNLCYNQRVIVTVGDPRTDYDMKIALSPAVAGNNNTLMSNAPGDMKSIWVEFTPAMPGLGVTWESSNPDVLSVKGTTNTTAASVTPKSAGTATITATADDGSGKKATVDITVKMVMSNIALDVPEGANPGAMPLNPVTLSVFEKNGGSWGAPVVLTPLDPSAVRWSSDDENVATVTDAGVVTPLKKGSVIIKATALDGSGAYGVIRLVFTDTAAASYEEALQTNEEEAAESIHAETEVPETEDQIAEPEAEEIPEGDA